MAEPLVIEAAGQNDLHPQGAPLLSTVPRCRCRARPSPSRPGSSGGTGPRGVPMAVAEPPADRPCCSCCTCARASGLILLLQDDPPDQILRYPGHAPAIGLAQCLGHGALAGARVAGTMSRV